MELLLLLIILNYLEEKEVIHMEFFLLLQIQFYIFILEDKGQQRLVLLHSAQMEDIMEEELAVKMEVIILILKLQVEEEEQHILRLHQDY